MIARYRQWRRRRAVRVECEVCGARVKPKDAVVLEGFFDTGDTFGGQSLGLISATYCKADAPKEAA